MQESISDNFRAMQEKHGRGSLKPWQFWAWLGTLGALFHAYFLNGWSFLTMALLLLVGAAAEYWKSKHVEVPHIVVAALVIEKDDDLEIKNKTYWIEAIQFLMIVVIVTLVDFVWK